MMKPLINCQVGKGLLWKNRNLLSFFFVPAVPGQVCRWQGQRSQADTEVQGKPQLSHDENPHRLYQNMKTKYTKVNSCELQFSFQ